MTASLIAKEIEALSDKTKSKNLGRFFKTGPGEYGEGDLFLWVSVPVVRKIVQAHATSSTLSDAAILLARKEHELRLAGVLLFVNFSKKRKYTIEELAKFYMNHRECINNWDLVDVSSEYIIGPYLERLEGTPDLLGTFIEDCITSKHLWTNRIIVIATFHFIKRGDASLIYGIAPRFFTHRHDLMHKAVGWMLREAGKRVSMEQLDAFILEHAPIMPRTMLRYAIERFDEPRRRHFLSIPRDVFHVASDTL